MYNITNPVQEPGICFLLPFLSRERTLARTHVSLADKEFFGALRVPSMFVICSDRICMGIASFRAYRARVAGFVWRNSNPVWYCADTAVPYGPCPLGRREDFSCHIAPMRSDICIYIFCGALFVVAVVRAAYGLSRLSHRFAYACPLCRSHLFWSCCWRLTLPVNEDSL